MKKTLLKLSTILAQAIIYFLGVTGAHEQAHMVAANNLGVPGHVLFRLDWGFFVYESPQTLTTFQDVTIGLAGGFGVALAFGILWAIQHLQGKESPSELDTAAIFAIIVILQFFYGVSEGIEIWMGWFKLYAQLIGVVAGVGVIFLLYGGRLLRWIGGENEMRIRDIMSKVKWKALKGKI